MLTHIIINLLSYILYLRVNIKILKLSEGVSKLKGEGKKATVLVTVNLITIRHFIKNYIIIKTYLNLTKLQLEGGSKVMALVVVDLTAVYYFTRNCTIIRTYLNLIKLSIIYFLNKR